MAPYLRTVQEDWLPDLLRHALERRAEVLEPQTRPSSILFGMQHPTRIEKLARSSGEGRPASRSL